MILRLYSGDDGESHLEELNVPAGELENVAVKAGDDARLRRYPEGRFSDEWHHAPRRQYVIYLEGDVQIGLGDGTVQRLGPGDAIIAEDLTGRGHTFSSVAAVPMVLMTVPLPD